ncbi:hypothetical protein D9754_06165 [Planomicrobium sp. Y74]|nr:hypothetical protein D9754_06165 [Planomicrobium sp. Y74]
MGVVKHNVLSVRKNILYDTKTNLYDTIITLYDNNHILYVITNHKSILNHFAIWVKLVERCSLTDTRLYIIHCTNNNIGKERKNI